MVVGFGIATAVAVFAGCALPSINLATEQPLKVDINMRLDVYQHDDPNAAPTTASQTAPNPDSPVPQASRENREADIQVFKNSRLIGESRDGLLVVLEEPPGDYGSFLRRTVQLENDDRLADMKALAEKEKRPLPEIRKTKAALWYNRSFTGEWVEVEQPGGGYKWIQKEG